MRRCSQPIRGWAAGLLTSRVRRAVLVATLLSAALIAPAPAASASVLWTADAERASNQEWANAAAQEPSRVQRITSPVAQGNYAYSLELRPGDNPGGYGERDELAMGNPTGPGFPLFNEGDERWIAFQVYLPSDYPINAPSWNDILQLKQLGSLGTPALSMGVERGKFTFKDSATNHEDSQPTVEEWSGPASQSRWIRFAMHVKFSPAASVGFVELYGDLDGAGMKQLMARTFMHTMKEQGGVAVPGHARIGQYRDSAMHLGVSHIYFDGFTIATDRSSAEANAFAPAGSPAPAAVVAAEGRGEASQQSSSSATPSPRAQAAAASRRASGVGRAAARSRAKRARRAHRHGVWLRQRHAPRAPAASHRHMARIVGGVAAASGAPRLVVIEAYRAGSWTRVTTARDARGHFSLLLPVRAGAEKLRAFASGVGYSRALLVRS